MGTTQLTPEPLNDGLVTVRDAATLTPGQLAQADNAYYLPNDQAIHKAKGRTKYNAVALGAPDIVKGIRYLEFEGPAYLIAHGGSNLYLSPFTDETGTFSTTIAAANGTTLDTLNFNNRFFALIGNTANYLINADGSARVHGVAPVTRLATGSEPGAPAIAAGTFNPDLGTGFFFFLTTEVVDDGQNEPIESTFTGVPATAVSALTTPSSQAYTITKPTTVNANATKWRVYMSNLPQTNPTPIPNLNTFRLMAEQDIAVTTVTIGNKGGSIGQFPTTSTTIVGGWSNPNNAFTDNGTGTRSSTTGSKQDYQTFGFDGTLSGTVKGIEVYVKFKTPDYTPLKNIPIISLQLSPDNGASFFPTAARYFLTTQVAGAVTAYQTVVQGNPNDTWGRAWTTAEFNNANFRVRLTYLVKSTGAIGGNAIVDVDYIQVKVYTTGATTSVVNVQGKPFRTVNVSVAGITTTYPADGQPPVATTGDVFEGQMALNDVSDASIIRYSLPDFVESFPSIYFLNFETKNQDTVTLIRRLGNKLIVGLKQQLYRVNYLPRETDAEFDRGRSYEAISESEGIVGSQAACLFSPTAGSLFLAYVSHSGVGYTDGFQTFALNHDLDWPSTVRLPAAGDIVNYLASCVMVNYPLNEQIWLYYTPPGQTTNTKAIVFHYNVAHRREDGTFKATGPIDVSAVSATNARLAGNDVLITGQAAGFTYVEDRGYTHNAGGTIAFAVKTREIMPAGLGGSATVENTFIRHQQDATSTVTITPYTRVKDSAQTTGATKTFTTANAGAAKHLWNLNAETFQWGFTEPGAPGGAGVRLSGFTQEIYGTGLPEPRT